MSTSAPRTATADAVASPATAQPKLAARLGKTRVGVRRDLEITRHVFGGEPCYVVRDPITFQSHRLEPDDYHVMMSIDPSLSLGETFGTLVEQGYYEPEHEESFYEFVLALHGLGFLRLPISDEKTLYRRHQARTAARHRQRAAGFLFLQIPLVNPDAFLKRTLPYVRWVFSSAFFVIWLMVVSAAAYTVACNWRALSEPASGLLANNNLPVLWATLVVLKVFHELGHAYACRRFDGHVPEMGAYLILFTPCAYVDATAAWGFSRRLHRLIVSMAGMYVELFIAAIAVFVWVATTPSLINSIAYNVIFLASTVTVLFNANPLMRYDGYYILSDLLEIPNLRQRSAAFVAGLAKRVTLGIPNTAVCRSNTERLALLPFGIAATIYRVIIMVAIVAVIAHKLPFVGYAIGICYFGMVVCGLIMRLTRYLWYSTETAPIRRRAIALSIVVLGGAPAALLLVPIPTSPTASGVVSARDETTVRVDSAGFVERIGFHSGKTVPAGEVLVELSNLTLGGELAKMEAELESAEIRRAALEASDLSAAHIEQSRATFGRVGVDRARARCDALLVRAPEGGQIVSGLKPHDLGRFLAPGEAVATIVSGHPEVRVVLSADDAALVSPRIGSRITFRARNSTGCTRTGSIQRVIPAASREISLVALTHLAGGDIAVEGPAGTAAQPYVEVRVALDDVPGAPLEHGITGVVQFDRRLESLGTKLHRAFMRFTTRMMQS